MSTPRTNHPVRRREEKEVGNSARRSDRLTLLVLALSLPLATIGCATRGETEERFKERKAMAERTIHPEAVAGAENGIPYRRSEAWRPVPSRPGRPGEPKCDAYYIEGVTAEDKRKFSCSFVEFDEHGDFLDFDQHEAAWRAIRDLSLQDSKVPLLVVIYCHGWKNNVDSDDVLKFNQFLAKLAEIVPKNADAEQSPIYRVHGVYLGWRGNSFPAYVSEADVAASAAEFKEPIIDQEYCRQFQASLWFPEFFSYYNRKKQAEFEVSGVPMARTIFACALAAKKASQVTRRGENKVLLIGHSFGALMLEKCVGQACLGSTMAQWQWSEAETDTIRLSDGSTVPSDQSIRAGLPFDSILFVNSAAPSTHTKELSDLLWAHDNRMRHLPKVDSTRRLPPIIISITSEGDFATGSMHRLVNSYEYLNPSFLRKYDDGIFHKGDKGNPAVPQSYYYDHTPGFNPLLVQYWINPAATDLNENVRGERQPNSARAIAYSNWLEEPVNPCRFYIHNDARGDDGYPTEWELHQPTSTDDEWRKYDGKLAEPKGAYWIVRCDKRLIPNHTDIWSDKAMDLYIGLFRLTEWMRVPDHNHAELPESARWILKVPADEVLATPQE